MGSMCCGEDGARLLLLDRRKRSGPLGGGDAASSQLCCTACAAASSDDEPEDWTSGAFTTCLNCRSLMHAVSHTSKNYQQLDAHIHEGKGHKSELNSPMPSSLSSTSLGTLPGCHILPPDSANRQRCSRSSSSSAMYSSFRPQPPLMPSSILD